MPTTDISTETGTSGPSRRSGTVASDVPLAVPPNGLQGGVLRLQAGSPPRTGAPSQASGGGDPASERAVMERCAAECLHVASGGESTVHHLHGAFFALLHVGVWLTACCPPELAPLERSLWRVTRPPPGLSYEFRTRSG